MTIADRTELSLRQNINVYVDASGIFVISATDLDGGSTGPIVTFSASQTTFTCADIGAGGGGSPLNYRRY